MGFEILEGAGGAVGLFCGAGGGRDLAVFLPPATGRLEPQLEEAREAANAGLNALVVAPPYIHERGEWRAFWAKNAESIAQLVDEVRMRHSLTGRSVCLGKNLGGSYAAFVLQYWRFDFVWAYGSIPRLSEFWAYSRHPVAVQARGGSQEPLPSFLESTREFDLLEGLQRSGVKACLQLGTRDEWIDDKQREAVLTQTMPNLNVHWHDDDHEMESPETRKARAGFLRSLIIRQDVDY